MNTALSTCLIGLSKTRSQSTNRPHTSRPRSRSSCPGSPPHVPIGQRRACSQATVAQSTYKKFIIVQYVVTKNDWVVHRKSAPTFVSDCSDNGPLWEPLLRVCYLSSFSMSIFQWVKCRRRYARATSSANMGSVLPIRRGRMPDLGTGILVSSSEPRNSSDLLMIYPSEKCRCLRISKPFSPKGDK